MTYVNTCSGDWWAGGSFSNRRFDSLLPILAFGLAAAIDVAARAAGRAAAGRAGPVALALAVVAWNVALMEQVRRGLVPRDDTVAFPDAWWAAARDGGRRRGQPSHLARELALRLAASAGRRASTTCWWAATSSTARTTWAGTSRSARPGDEAMLGEGWGPAQVVDGVRGARRARAARGSSPPLDVPEDLELRVRVAGPGAEREVRVSVNGREAGRFWAEPSWLERRSPRGRGVLAAGAERRGPARPRARACW